jgi:hypothetical protein
MNQIEAVDLTEYLTYLEATMGGWKKQVPYQTLQLEIVDDQRCCLVELTGLVAAAQERE